MNVQKILNDAFVEFITASQVSGLSSVNPWRKGSAVIITAAPRLSRLWSVCFRLLQAHKEAV